MNARGEEFGEARLTDQLGSAREASAASFLKGLISSVDSFVGDAGRQDDVTCLVLRYTGPQSASAPGAQRR
jgi:serine phosphatase RsbU (regulator of sigma subunit)